MILLGIVFFYMPLSAYYTIPEERRVTFDVVMPYLTPGFIFCGLGILFLILIVHDYQYSFYLRRQKEMKDRMDKDKFSKGW